MTPRVQAAAICLPAFLVLAGCTTPARPAPGSTAEAATATSGDVLALSGHVDGIDNGCFADGECSVSVDGLKVVTMRGWSQSTWGQRDPDLVPGDRVDVRCRTADGHCTLEGSDEYFLRKAR